jgi:PIN domain nuclease of toxin-antitoxin system
MSNIRYVLDTHTLVWAVLTPDRVGRKARKILEERPPETIGIPATVVRELGLLLALDKIEVRGSPLDVFAPVLERWPQIPISLRAALKAPVTGLPHGDPNDRMIVATALDLGVPLLTKDANITDSGVVEVVW